MAITRCLFLFVLLLVAGCAPQVQPPLNSPDGRFTLVTSVEHSRADPITYLCVIFEIQDKSGKVLHAENTRASDVSRWKMRWISNDRIELDSSDIGIYYWKKQPNGTWEKEPDSNTQQNESIPVTPPRVSPDVPQTTVTEAQAIPVTTQRAPSNGAPSMASVPVKRPRTIREAMLAQGTNGGTLSMTPGPFGAYDKSVRESISQRWYELLNSKNYATNTGKVIVAFDLRFDGQVANVRVTDSTVTEELSETCSQAITNAGPFERWSSDMRRMIGSEVRQITFTFDFR